MGLVSGPKQAHFEITTRQSIPNDGECMTDRAGPECSSSEIAEFISWQGELPQARTHTDWPGSEPHTLTCFPLLFT